MLQIIFATSKVLKTCETLLQHNIRFFSFLLIQYAAFEIYFVVSNYKLFFLSEPVACDDQNILLAASIDCNINPLTLAQDIQSYTCRLDMNKIHQLSSPVLTEKSHSEGNE